MSFSLRCNTVLSLSLVCAAQVCADDTAEHSRIDLHGDPLPEGALSRLGTIRYRQAGWYKHVEFLPGGHHFVVSTKDNQPRVWDAASGRLVDEYKKSGQMVWFRVTESGDGALLTNEINGETRICHTRFMLKKPSGGKLLSWDEPFTKHSIRFVITPQHDVLITGTYDGAVRIIDLQTGETQRTLELFRGQVQAMRLSPNGKQLAIAGRRDVIVWNWQTNEQPVRLAALPRGGQALRYSHDGRLLVVGSRDTCAASIFDASTQKKLRDLNPDSDNYYREDVCFSPDGKYLFVPNSRSNQVELFDVQSTEFVKVFDSGSVGPRSVSVSDDGRFLVTCGTEAELVVWDLTTGEKVSDRFPGHSDFVPQVRFSENHETVLTAGVDGVIHRWETKSGRLLQTLKHDRWVVGLSRSPDDSMIASVSLDDSVRIWNVPTGRELHRFSGHGMTGGASSTAIAFDPTGRLVWSFGMDFFLQKFDVGSGRRLSRLKVRPHGVKFEEDENGLPKFDGANRFFSIQGTVFDSSRNQLLLSLQNAIVRFDTSTGQEISRYVQATNVERFALSPDGKALAVITMLPRDTRGNRTSRLDLVDIDSSSVRASISVDDFSYQLQFVRNDVVAMALNHRSSPGSAASVMFADAASGKTLCEVPVGDRQIRHVAFADDKLMAVCHENGAVHIHSLPRLITDTLGEQANERK